MDYRDRLYRGYISTHTAHYKNRPTLEEFRLRSALYRRQLGPFIPARRDIEVLDAGCGAGSIVWWLHGEGYHRTCGVDISEEQIEAGRALGVKNIERADLKEFLKDREARFDLIIARDVLEHMEKEELVSILELFHRALKKDGRLILQVPNGESPFFGRIRYGDFTHQLAFTHRSITQVLSATGFGKIEVYPVRPVGVGLKSTVRAFLWRFTELFYRVLLFTEVGSERAIVTQNILAVADKG